MNTPLPPDPAAALPAPSATLQAPLLFAPNPRAEKRFWEFFTANIRNRNTRAAYLRAVLRFADWCAARGLTLERIEPIGVAAYIEELTHSLAAPTVKQHLSALRQLFDWLVLGQVVPVNPAAVVRGPKHVVRSGKTPILSAQEARALLDSIDTAQPVGLRDRALISVMLYSFARVSAAVAMRVSDYYTQGKRSYFRLHEKGGRFNVVPAHHVAQAHMDAYLAAVDFADDRAGPLFRACGRVRKPMTFVREPLPRRAAIRMVKRRARRAGLPEELSPHSFRGTGITEYLRNGGELETAARIAGHESTRTTQLYNRVHEEVTLDEIERILI